MCIKKKNQWIREIPKRKKIIRGKEKKKEEEERNANIIEVDLALLCRLLQWGFHLMLVEYFYFNNIIYNSSNTLKSIWFGKSTLKKKKLLQEKKRKIKKIMRNANIIAANLALLCHLLQLMCNPVHMHEYI